MHLGKCLEVIFMLLVTSTYPVEKRFSDEKAFEMLTLLVIILILTPSIRIMENLLEVQSEKIN